MKNALPHDAIPTPLDEIHVRVLNCQAIRLTGSVMWHSDNNCVPYWRLYWNKTAGAALIANGRRIALLPDYGYIVTPNTVTSNRRSRSLDHYFIHFVAAPPYDRVLPEVVAFAVTPELTAAFEHLTDLVGVNPHRKQMLSTRALFLCYYALSKVPERCFCAEYCDQRIQRAITCMDQSLAHPADNACLAQAAGMHPTAFIRLFKKCTGFAPQTFFQIRRVEEACRLLHFTNKKTDEIASNMGFYDRYHFSRVFKRIRGVTPACFRRKR